MPEKDFYHVSLKTILKNEQGQILGLYSQDNGEFKGFYDLPGGRIDDNEFQTPFDEIIKREIIEEVGPIKVELNSVKPVAYGRHLIPSSRSKTGQEIHVMYLFFESRYLEGEIAISPEHQWFKWLDIKNQKDAEKYFTSGIREGISIYLLK